MLKVVFLIHVCAFHNVLGSDVCHGGYITDGDPVFSLPPLTGDVISVREDSPPGTVVYTVSANDTEYYELNTVFPEFGLNGNQIVVTGGLDYETTKEYTLNVSAFECVYAEPVISGNLVIDILPANEYPPHPQKDVIFKSLIENAGPDQEVANLTCTDQDQGASPGCSFSIQDGDDSIPKFKHSAARILTTNSPIDYEMLAGQGFLYSLTVVAVDHPQNDPPKTGSTALFVTVLPQNDNTPVFSSSTYSAQVGEDISPGSHVLNVSAEDQDLGPDGELTYDITAGNIDNKFYIDPYSGQISSRAPLDFESVTSYQLSVRVTDGGGLSQNVTVDIDVTNVNDNTPECSANETVVEIDGNTLTGNTVMTLNCSDRDAGSILSYQLQEDGDGTFGINPSGEITLTKDLNNGLARRSYRLKVVVSDGFYSVLVDRQVLVKPVNQFRPVLPPSAVISVPENEATSSVLYTAIATDADNVLNNITSLSYLISTVTNNGESLFWMDRNTGDIVLVNSLDFEKSQSYLITYFAEDDGKLRATSTLTVSVVNVNDNSPHCDPDVISALIPENTDVSILTAYGLNCVDNDGDSLQYEVIQQQPNEAVFDINSLGKLLLNKSLDYEARAYYDITIEVTDGQSTALVSVAVNILDVNEGAPVFTSSGIYNSTLPETSRKGHFVTRVSADDVDLTTVSYEFKDNYNDFIVDLYRGDIFLKNQLDREVNSLYTLLVMASDGSLTSTATVYVNVDDVNEPVTFVQSAYTFTTDEGTPKSTFVGQVSAVDIDKEGEYGEIRYAIESGNVHSHFAINPNDGILTIADTADYEEISKFELVVSVTDMGDPPLSDRCHVTITILDINDSPPVFPAAILSVSVSESTAIGEVITQISAMDADSMTDNNNRFSFSATSATPFNVHASTGIVTVDETLDRETQNKYEIEILAIDEGRPPLTGTVTLEVHIDDINDNIPQIIGSYDTMIAENSPIQSVVFQISVQDIDLSNLLHYSIESGNHDSHFKIEPYSGYIQVTSVLDRETRSVYYLVIKVSDQKLTPRSSTATATVSISDINDGIPRFIPGPRKFSVDENVPFRTVVGRLQAEDDDEGINAKLRFKVSSFVIGTAGRFLIDEITGELFTNMTLDRETESLYQLTISVEDGGSPPLTSEVTIQITVNDLNDNHPVFHNSFYSKTISEDTSIGTKIVTTAATDVDMGFYSDITYELDLTSREGLLADFYFTVDDVFGDVILKRSLDFEAHEVLSMVVIAKDGDVPPKTATTNVTIYITDVNDNRPEFRPVFYNTEAPLAEVCDFVIARLSATDRDQTNNAEIFYVMEPAFEQSSFVVDFETGNIRARYDLNDSQYVINVQVKDNGEPRLTSSVSAKVRIDTFQADLNVFSFKISLTKDNYLRQEIDFLSEVKAAISLRHPSAYVRRWCIYERDSSVIVHLYAVENDLSDWIYNLHIPKPFLKTSEVLTLLKPDGISDDVKRRFSIVDIDGYSIPPKQTNVPEVAPISDTTEDHVVPIAVTLPILFLALLAAAILIFLAWKRKWCKKKNPKEETKDKNSDRTTSSPNTPHAVSPSGVKINPENVGTRNVTGPFIDVPGNDSPVFDQRPPNSITLPTSNSTASMFDKRGMDPVTGWFYVENSQTKERKWIKFPDKDPLFQDIASTRS